MVGNNNIVKRKVIVDATFSVAGQSTLLGTVTGMYGYDSVGLTAELSISGSGMTYNWGTTVAADIKRIFVAGTSGVDVYNAETQQLIGTIASASSIWYVAYAENTQRVFFKSVTTGTIFVYNALTLASVGTVTVTGTATGGLCYNPSNGKIYSGSTVANPNSRVDEIDTTTLTVTNSSSYITLTENLGSLQYISETGKLYATSFLGGASSQATVYVININTMSVESTITVPFFGAISVSNCFSYSIEYINNHIFFSFLANRTGFTGQVHILNPSSNTFVGGFYDSTATKYAVKQISSTGSVWVSGGIQPKVFSPTNPLIYNSIYDTSSANGFSSAQTTGTNSFIIDNIYYAQSTQINLFDNNSSLSSDVTATMMGTYTYNQFIHSLLGTPLSVKKISIYCSSNTSTNYSQLTQTVSFVRNTNLGTSATDQQYPAIDPYQNQSAIVGLPVDEFKLDALNYIQYNIYYGQSVQLVIEGEYLFEDKFAKEVGQCEDNEKIEEPTVQPEIRVEIINPFKRICI